MDHPSPTKVVFKNTSTYPEIQTPVAMLIQYKTPQPEPNIHVYFIQSFSKAVLFVNNSTILFYNPYLGESRKGRSKEFGEPSLAWNGSWPDLSKRA